MSRIGKIARRTFLVASTAIVGGVAFGYVMYQRDPKNPLLDNLADGEAALTPYVKIDADTITLITPRADSGQGAYSVQAMMIAEELDVELDQISVDPGPPSPAYYNTALATEAAPFQPTDDSFGANATRGVMDAMMKFMGMQITGGSTTVPDGYEKLRLAGASARETLKAAASAETGVPTDQMRTEAGKVILPDGTERTYQSLAVAAAQIDPVQDVPLRDASQWRLMGKEVQRLDVMAKSTGTQSYGIDFEIDGMLHATVRTNPRRGLGAKGFDADAARMMPGVQAVLPIAGGVAVVANNTWRAFQAAQAVDIDWDTATPYPEEQDGHWQVLSESFVEDRLDSRNRDEGDVETALQGAEVIEAEYRAPYLAHSPLEPINATVRVTEDRVDVWTGTQIPRFLQSEISKITGHDRDQIHIHALMIGGSFGHRLEPRVVQEATEIAAQLPGTPVKLTYSREEDWTHNDTRQIAMARGRGTVANGQVQTMDLSIAMPSVVESQMGRIGLSMPGPDLQIVAGAWEQPYAIPNYRVSGYRAPQLAPISSWRAVGASTNGFFHDTFLDELIHAAGADPMEERMRLMWHDTSRKTLEAVAEMSNWGTETPPGTGRGVAFTTSFGVPTAEVVEVSVVDGAIRIDRVWVAADVGTVIDPIMFENMVQGGIVWALGHAMNSEVTYSGGAVEQQNFYDSEGMRLAQAPQIVVRGLENAEQIRGMGEPMVPPAAAALSNAIFAATGQRIREMPMMKHIDFV